MLTHSNLLYQLNNLSHFLQPLAGESSLSLLPPWHIYERSCGYFIYSRGMKQVYTNIRRFREDLTKFPPQFFVCVPLVIDTLQTKVGACWTKLSTGSAVCWHHNAYLQGCTNVTLGDVRGEGGRLLRIPCEAVMGFM